MTFFDISESIASSTLIQHREQYANGYSTTYSDEAGGLQNPLELAKAHLSLLADGFVGQGSIVAESFAKSLAEKMCFTSIDQAFILWGAASAVIFSLAQFSLLSWTTQAVIDAAITGACITWTSRLTWQIAEDANLRWVVFLWAALMASGMALTAYGIFCSVGAILIDLCPLWLGLCTLGYGAMGMKMRSRSFTAAALVHGIGIFSVSFAPSWQFLASGLIMALTLFFFSVVPWDMRTVPTTGEPC